MNCGLIYEGKGRILGKYLQIMSSFYAVSQLFHRLLGCFLETSLLSFDSTLNYYDTK